MAATYELLLADPFGTKQGVLDRFSSCTYVRTVGDVGEMSLVLPANAYDVALFQPDSRIYVQRALPGGVPYLDMETCWFVRDLPKWPELDAQGAEVIQVDCQDAVSLLASRIIPYNEGDPTTLKLAAADDMCKAVARENLGALATDTARDLTAYLSVAANQALGKVVKQAFARAIVLDTLKKIVAASWELGTYVTFDVVVTDPVTGKLEFRTYAGQRGEDHRFPGGQPPVVLDPNLGNLAQVSLGFLYRDEKTYVYVGGQGMGTIRAVQTASDAARIGRSPFNRRELWVDASSSNDATVLTNTAQSALRKARPINTFTGTLIEQENTLRGVHWDFGDFLTANYRNASYDVRVDKVAVTLTNSQQGIAEQVIASLRSDK